MVEAYRPEATQRVTVRGALRYCCRRQSERQEVLCSRQELSSAQDIPTTHPTQAPSSCAIRVPAWSARHLASQRWSWRNCGSGALRGDRHVLFDVERRVWRERRARYIGKCARHVKQVEAQASRLNRYVL